jgi:hypothetical protein
MTETPRPQLPEASPSPTVFEVAGIQVLIDEDVARLFGVETRRVNEQLKRNPTKFAGGAAYRPSDEEYRDLRSQNATSSGWGGRRHPPIVFNGSRRRHGRHGPQHAARHRGRPRFGTKRTPSSFRGSIVCPNC